MVWVSLTFPPYSLPCILYMYPCYGFQWSNISRLLSLLKMYAFEEFWYVFWIFQMQDILWIFDIRIWMNFYFHCHDKDLWSSLLCRLYWWWKMSHIFFLCIILQLFCAVFLLHSVQSFIVVILLLLSLSWLLRNKMQISYGNR